MIINVENPRESRKQMLELISELSKVTEYRVNVENQLHPYIPTSAKKGQSSPMVFPIVIYGCERWTIKKAEHRRIDAFELCCWRRLFRVPWTARRANQSILKETSPGCSLEGTDAEAETPILWPPDAKNGLTGKYPDAGKD